MKGFGVILLVGSVIAGFFVVFAPSVDYWGMRHEAHEKTQRFVLKSGEHIGQTFLLEEHALAGVAVWVDTKQSLPTQGNILLDIKVAGNAMVAQYDVRDIPESGIVVFQFPKPIAARRGDKGTYLLGLSEQKQSITLLFQIDAAIYSEGNVIHPNAGKQGDLAFQLVYKRPALGSRVLHIIYALVLFACGLGIWWGLKKYSGEKIRVSKKDIWVTLSVGIFVTLFYGTFLVRSGYWVGPTDFTKDAAYLGAGASALKNLAWPTWMHTICGGLPLLGGIEGNTVSIGTLFALFMDSQHALMLMNIVEAGIAAAGAYALARLFSATKLGAVAAAAIYGLSPVYIFKLSIGYSMIGGVFMFAPWALFFFIAGAMKARALYAVISGLLLGLTVLRGEAHIIVVLAFLLIVWALYDAIANKRIRALLLLGTCFAMAFVVSSIKILPYVEHLSSEPVHLRAYVAPLLQNNLLFETLLTVNADHETVPVLHGKFGEEWGVFGSYVGYVSLMLAGAGLFVCKPYRFGTLLLLFISLLLSEGTLFEHGLRFISPLDALLRMPVRNMLLVVLLIAIFAARGLDFILGFVKIAYVQYAFYVCVIIFLCIDLGRATYLVIRHSMNRFEQLASPNATSPMFANYEVRGDTQQNANMLLARGFLLPQVCADQNRTVAFIKNAKIDTPLASVPFTLTSNGITLAVPAGTDDIQVYERFDKMWASGQAYVLERTDGSLRIVPHKRSGGDISLEQVSPTKLSQQAILLTVLSYIATLLICRKSLE